MLKKSVGKVSHTIELFFELRHVEEVWNAISVMSEECRCLT